MGREIKVIIVDKKLRVFFDEIMHLSIDINELVGVQSYHYGDYRFAIDYVMKTTLIETCYTDKQKWKSILDGLAKISIV